METPQSFTLDELWCLHAAIRHEIPDAGKWEAPPASLPLNNQIADAILLCIDTKCDDAALILDMNMLLAIDATVLSSMKDPKGMPVGRDILVKCFRSRRELSEVPLLMADSDGQHVPIGEIQLLVATIEERHSLWKRQRPNKESSDASTNTDPNDYSDD